MEGLFLVATVPFLLYVMVLTRTGLHLPRNERFQPGWRPFAALWVLVAIAVVWLAVDLPGAEMSLALGAVIAGFCLASLYAYRRAPGPKKRRP